MQIINRKFLFLNLFKEVIRAVLTIIFVLNFIVKFIFIIIMFFWGIYYFVNCGFLFIKKINKISASFCHK